jgi:hypothetical protein
MNFLSVKNAGNVPSKSNKQKNILKVTDEKSGNRIRYLGSGALPKCHGLMDPEH